MTASPNQVQAPGRIAQPAPSGASSPAPIWKVLLADRHFLAACVILIVTASGWGAASRWLNVHTTKERVPWPAGATVGSDFRLTSLARSFGPFKRIEPTDPVMKMFPKEMSDPGETVLPEKFLEPLGIGTDADIKHLPERRSNWYVARMYWDTRPGSRYPLWQIQVYYYTGGGDTVPHVPEICLRAGGMKVQAEGPAAIHVPDLPPPWKTPVPFYRTRAVDADGAHPRVEYYTFSMNGRWGESRMWVRWELLNPFLRHAYFAKIQFSPVLGPTDFAETDRAAEDFLRHALPEVLKALPSEADIQKLEGSASTAPPA